MGEGLEFKTNDHEHRLRPGLELGLELDVVTENDSSPATIEMIPESKPAHSWSRSPIPSSSQHAKACCAL